jgi:hypothetical protein
MCGNLERGPCGSSPLNYAHFGFFFFRARSVSVPENTIELHPLANMFPLLEGQQFLELVEDVPVHGLRDPIVLFDGAILDGRNRYWACIAAQVAARFETYTGKDAIAYVVTSISIGGT